ncbi:hypothetical protein OKA04_23260 [Luteolibacter flavescens]|uniref:Ribbon-helix-helix protein CopG domain-containing protein n=1 Tax=Luteolibacter flavescens TaxID=1859460 RepID=A0ABT3FVR7_9BACT|nr:hypothetical protein [Luteolibacter flavescens]MCW1887675.1 hypothetical protein [Luteolibacter flavescens]
MKLNNKTSLTLSDHEVAILDITAARNGISRNEVMRHLIIYQGLCGGDFPLTARILGLPPKDRELVVAEIRRKAEAGEFVKPQSFRIWIKETIGTDDPAEMERGIDALIRKLKEGDQ